jgi:hypothetical protein
MRSSVYLPAAVEPEHFEGLRPVAASLRIPTVGRVRRLTVRLDRQVVMQGRGEGCDDIATAPPARIWRHFERGVLWTSVATGSMSPAPRHRDSPPQSRGRARTPSERSVTCWLRVGIRWCTVRRASCSMLFTELTVVSSRDRGLFGREAEHVAEKEYRTLRSRDVLQSRDERELDGLTLLVTNLRRRVPETRVWWQQHQARRAAQPATDAEGRP